MSLQDIYLIAGVVTGLGVIISLLFVGYQMREQVREARLNANYLAGSEIRQMLEQNATNPERFDLLDKSLRHPESMTTQERAKLFLIMGAQMRLFESLYYQNRDGRMDDWMWTSALYPFLFLLKNPCFEPYWSVHGGAFTADFHSFVGTLQGSERIKGIPAVPDYGPPDQAVGSD